VAKEFPESLIELRLSIRMTKETQSGRAFFVSQQSTKKRT
jgi:hypothetical protein